MKLAIFLCWTIAVFGAGVFTARVMTEPPDIAAALASNAWLLRPAAPDVTPVYKPEPICFGTTIRGDGVVVTNSFFDNSPILIVGKDATLSSNVINGGHYGIYLAGDTTAWLQGTTIIGAQVGVARGVPISIIGKGPGPSVVSEVSK